MIEGWFTRSPKGKRMNLGLRGWDRDNLWDKGFFRQVLAGRRSLGAKDKVRDRDFIVCVFFLLLPFLPNYPSGPPGPRVPDGSPKNTDEMSGNHLQPKETSRKW